MRLTHNAPIRRVREVALLALLSFYEEELRRKGYRGRRMQQSGAGEQKEK